MSELDSSRLVTLKRCPQCKKPDLLFINIFAVKEFDKREFVDLYCPNCLVTIEKDKYGSIISIINHINKPTERGSVRWLLPPPKKRPFEAFLIKRRDLHG